MKRTGSSDLPLHYGSVPKWLSERMARLGALIVQAVVMESGKREFLSRLADPFWFQALGAVMGMDWHSSGITTSVMGALKKGLHPLSKELGIYVCGGRGRHSRATPDEILAVSGRTGLDGDALARCSRLSAKVDNTAVQDGFQLYLHNFILTDEGDWAVVQQGMNAQSRMARRYHWLSSSVTAFDEEPHTGVVGDSQGLILNLTDKDARGTKDKMLEITRQSPELAANEIKRLVMPARHEVIAADVDLKRLGAVLAAAHEKNAADFCSLLLVNGLGPRTIQSLALVSEVIYGTPTRFRDPARYSFAHGGKDGHPFPVPLKVYDQTIGALKKAVESSKMGQSDKSDCLKRLHQVTLKIEDVLEPRADFDAVVAKEKRESPRYGGRTVSGPAKPPGLFD